MSTSSKHSEPSNSRLPCIFLHKGANQYVSKIGYKRVVRNEVAFRVRDFQRLGKNKATAMGRALALHAQWSWTVQHFKSSEHLKGEKPYWLPEKVVAAYRAGERGDLDGVYATGLVLNVGDHSGEEDYQSHDEQLKEGEWRGVTLRQAKDKFLAFCKSRIGLAGGKGLKDCTCLHYSYDIEQTMRFIDAEKPLWQVGRLDIETLVNRLMALPENLNKPGEKISIRTAVNYCKAFKKLIDWLDSREDSGWSKPKGTDAIFRFRGFNPIDIRPYTNDELKAIVAAHPERFRLYPLLAINCGYYQIDIATLRHDHLVTIKDGKTIAIADIRTFSGDVFIKRRRQKTLHQNDFETLCYLWPEVVELLRKYAAPMNNTHGLVLLNENGMPLQRKKTNNITNRFNRYKKDAGLARDCEFKQFRKTGATWIENRFDDRTARLYNAHAIGGELKRYAAQTFDGLTVALKAWREELRGAGVL